MPQPLSRRGRERRPSDRVGAKSKWYHTLYLSINIHLLPFLSVRDEEEAAARKEEKIRRRAERERAKAQQALDATGNIPDEADGDREERHSGTVDLFF